MNDTEDMDGGGLALAASSNKSNRKIRHTRQLGKFKERLHELGWRKTYVNRHVEDYVGADLDEQPEHVLLDTWAKSWIPDDSDATEAQILYSAGLTRKMAKQLSLVIAPLQKSCYTRNQLIEIAIEYALGKYAPVLKPGQEYLVEIPQRDVWVPNARFKYVYNVSDFESLRLPSFPMEFPSGMTGVNAKMFFHATNYRSVIHIATYGIDHLKGRRCLDFGIQPGFYMTPDLSTAIEWCSVNRQRWHDELCIIVYSIPTDALKALKCKIFANPDEEWKTLVTESRRCHERINALDRFDAVYGPMAANVQSIKTKLVRPHKTPKFQLASKSNDSDDYFAKCFAGAIFIRVG